MDAVTITFSALSGSRTLNVPVPFNLLTFELTIFQSPEKIEWVKVGLDQLIELVQVYSISSTQPNLTKHNLI